MQADGRRALAGRTLYHVHSLGAAGAPARLEDADGVAAWFGREANLRFLPYEEFWSALPEPESDTARQHITRSHVVSIDKARTRLGYEPRYSSLRAVAEAVDWLHAHDRLGPDLPPIDLTRVS